MEYPESKALETWKHDDLVFSIVQHSTLNHYCGYVRFPKKPVREMGYNGILTYVPVHGGITFADSGKDGSMVYGFDCGHCDDWSEYTHSKTKYVDKDRNRFVFSREMGDLEKCRTHFWRFSCRRFRIWDIFSSQPKISNAPKKTSTLSIR